jgi:hypothetical protein
MGCEDFQAIVHTNKSVSECRALLSMNGRVADDPEGGPLPTSTYLLYEDGQHVFEIELGETTDGTQMSIRFALCHPDSVDAGFLELIRRMTEALSGRVSIMEDVSADVPELMRADDLVSLWSLVRSGIATKRQYWTAEFGSRRASITCAEAIRQYVVK